MALPFSLGVGAAAGAGTVLVTSAAIWCVSFAACGWVGSLVPDCSWVLGCVGTVGSGSTGITADEVRCFFAWLLKSHIVAPYSRVDCCTIMHVYRIVVAIVYHKHACFHYYFRCCALRFTPELLTRCYGSYAKVPVCACARVCVSIYYQHTTYVRLLAGVQYMLVDMYV